MPVLVCEDGVLADSADIVALRRPPRAGGAPAGSAGRRRGGPHAAEDFDARLGPGGRLWMYHALHGRRDIATGYGTAGGPGLGAAGASGSPFPLVSRCIDRTLGVTDEAAARSLAHGARRPSTRSARRLSDGRPYLSASASRAADLTFAALAARGAAAGRVRRALPQPAVLPAAMARRGHRAAEHPAGAFALRMYREERRAS